MATLKAGVWLGLGMIAAGMAYFALTWDDGNRPLLACTGLAVAVTDVGILFLPMQRIVAGRWRERFFLAWTLSNVAVLLLLGALDPTDPSPLTLPLMMPMLFAGMSYPRASARISCAAVVFGYGAEALIRGQDFAFSVFFAMVLVSTAGMCLWQARNRERQHDELERQRDELARVSLTDPLTDALNRRGFEDRLRRELADSVRSGRPLMLAVLDLDGFKAVNDREGHAAGDALLCETSGASRASCAPWTWSGASAETSSRCCSPTPARRTPRASSGACTTRSPAGCRHRSDTAAFRLTASIPRSSSTTPMSACMPPRPNGPAGARTGRSS